MQADGNAGQPCLTRIHGLSPEAGTVGDVDVEKVRRINRELAKEPCLPLEHGPSLVRAAAFSGANGGANGGATVGLAAAHSYPKRAIPSNDPDEEIDGELD